MPAPDADKLESWKEIAAFLGRDERTAMRWAKEQGMPVRRIPGGKRGRVYASRTEINDWLLGQDSRPEPVLLVESGKRSAPRKYLWPLALAVLLLTTGGGVLLLRSRGPATQPSRIEFSEDTVEVFDGQNRLLWSHKFAASLAPDLFSDIGGLKRLAHIVDLNGDGKKEVLIGVATRKQPDIETQFEAEVDCFSDTGKLLWSYTPKRTFRFGTYELSGTWGLKDLFVSREGPRRAVWASFAHGLWGDSFVVQIDPETGKDSLRFVNTGVLYVLGEQKTAGATYLLAGGFNSEYDGGVVALMDERKPFAATPQTAGTRHKCESCPPGEPDFVFAFPRSEINRLSGVYEDPVRQIGVFDEGILASRFEGRLSDRENTVYVLGKEPPFTPVSMMFNSEYNVLHEKLSREGKLKHSSEDCPERLHPLPVRVWTPASGWREAALPATSTAK